MLLNQDFSAGFSTPKSSELMQDIKRKYSELDGFLGERVPEDYSEMVYRIERAYEMLIYYAETYEENRNPRTAQGKERKELVTAIKENARKEYSIFGENAKNYHAQYVGGTFGDLVGGHKRV